MRNPSSDQTNHMIKFDINSVKRFLRRDGPERNVLKQAQTKERIHRWETSPIFPVNMYISYFLSFTTGQRDWLFWSPCLQPDELLRMTKILRYPDPPPPVTVWTRISPKHTALTEVIRTSPCLMLQHSHHRKNLTQDTFKFSIICRYL